MEIEGSENIKVEELIVDHIMFPVYNNDTFLDEMKEIWDAKNVGEIKRDDYDAYSGVFFQTKSFYVEYLSTNKGDGWWKNRICIVMDKKYWDYYQEPFIKDDFFLTPEITSGFFLVSPEYIKTSNNLVHKTDIVVVDEKGEYIAPFLQSNIPWIFE